MDIILDETALFCGGHCSKKDSLERGHPPTVLEAGGISAVVITGDQGAAPQYPLT
jgi:hypothetical protein